MRDYYLNLKFIGLMTAYTVLYILATIVEHIAKAKGIWKKKK